MAIEFKCLPRSRDKKNKPSGAPGLFLSFVVLVNLRIDEEKVVHLQPLLWTDGALIAAQDILGIDMANHRIDEGILGAMPGERGDVGIASRGSRDGTDAESCANALHSLADLTVEIVSAAFHVRFVTGFEKDLRKHALALHGLASVFVKQLLQWLSDRDVDGDFDLAGNLATDVGQLIIIKVVIVPFEISQVFQVAAIAEIEDEPPISGFLPGAFIVTNLDDVGHGDIILFAAAALLDGELRSCIDDFPLAKAVHDGTEGTEIDALRGVGQSGLVHRCLPLHDDGLVDIGRVNLGFLAFHDDGLFLGAFLQRDGGNGAAKEAVEVFQRGAVLKAGLFGFLAFAKLDPVFEECGSLLGFGFWIGDCFFKILKGELLLGIEGDNGIIDFVEGLRDLALGFVERRGAVFEGEDFGVVIVGNADASCM